jgi:hypothetical protein
MSCRHTTVPADEVPMMPGEASVDKGKTPKKSLGHS